MTNNEYIKAVIRSESAHYNMLAVSPRTQHGIDGIVTEAGELLDNSKKAKYYGKPFDKVNLKEELGDLLWYIGLICDEENFTIEELQELNIAKLKKRYPDKFEKDKALNRNLEGERKVLEQGINISIDDDGEALKLYHKEGYEPICPECGEGAFPTNFSPISLGGSKNDKRIVWFCKDMGHCAFSISKDIKWRKKELERKLK